MCFGANIQFLLLVERIDKSIRKNAEILASLHQDKEVLNNVQLPPKKKEIRYPFGIALVEFLIDRGMIKIIEKDKDLFQSSKKKNNSFYTQKSLHVKCLFNPTILPVQMNLPMIHPPMEWHYECPPEKRWLNISDLKGGYLSAKKNLYNKYQLMSSWDINHFFIYFGKNNDIVSHLYAKELCNVMNKLQSQPFKVNSNFLDNINHNELFYIQCGFILPSFIQYINLKGEKEGVREFLRKMYNKNPEIQDICNFNELFQVLSTNTQRARYEQAIMLLAEAYDG